MDTDTNDPTDLAPADLAQLFEIYLAGLLCLERIPVERRTLELAKIAMVFNHHTVDYCLECTAACPLHAVCKRTIPRQVEEQPVPSLTV